LAGLTWGDVDEPRAGELHEPPVGFDEERRGSRNAGLDGTDVALMPSRAVPQLASGASSSGSTSVTIPLNTSPGTYYVIAQADGDAAVAESAETNNVSVIRSIQVTAGP
jgi:hypothetical protein